MGMLGTDYTLRSVHVIFLILLASSSLFGFNYLSEMYERIQLQEKMESQMKHIMAERAIINSKESILQTQIDNRNKEMKRLKELYASQVEQQNSICEKEKNNLLETLLSKDDTIATVQTKNEHLKEQLEHLQFVLGQFEKNQSRLLEKFSTQSTQCMNVIHMLSELCHKGKGNVIQKIAQETKQKENSVYGAKTQLSRPVKATVRTLPPLDFPTKNTSKLSSTRPPTNRTISDSDHYKQSKQKPIQELQELLSELNNTINTQDIEDGILKLEKILNSTEENFNKSKSEEGGNENEIAFAKDLLKNMLIKKIILGNTQTTERQTQNEKFPVLHKVSESKKRNPVNLEKINNPQYPTLQLKDETLQLTDQNNRIEDKTDNMKSELKPYSAGKVQKKPQGLTLEKVKAPGQDIYKAKETYENEENTEDAENGLDIIEMFHNI